MPLLAICRGVQVLNVTFGGTLIQDIPSEVDDSVKHEQNAQTPRRPLVVILGGLRTGRDAVDLVDDTRGSVIAAVSYATSRKRLKSLGVTRGLPVARDTGQIGSGAQEMAPEKATTQGP